MCRHSQLGPRQAYQDRWLPESRDSATFFPSPSPSSEQGCGPEAQTHSWLVGVSAGVQAKCRFGDRPDSVLALSPLMWTWGAS